MGESKKSGKAMLRGVDGRRATGICLYSVSAAGVEVSVSAQLESAQAEAVLQYGADRDYLCRPPAPVSGGIKCRDTGIMAVWVLDSGKPALFCQIKPGAFDQAEARKRLPGAQNPQPSAPPKAGAGTLLPVILPSNPLVKPAGREPATEPEEPFRPAGQPSGEPSGLASGAGSGHPAKEPAEQLPPAAAEPQGGAAQIPAGAGVPPEVIEAAPVPQAAEAGQSQAAAEAPPADQPLAIKRAPRSPHPPVYSPLWDDVSVEFEKMLENLPKAHPFNGGAGVSEIAQLPTDGAVQCYIGSVIVDGMKVFLQAVPARPFCRPAGFDHTLVSRDGECFWVKYFIQDN